MKSVVTIAGFDPSSGAGITRDLDIFFSLGIHGVSAPTSVVVQGPPGVREVHPLPVNVFSAIISGIQKDIRVDGVKVGVAWDEEFVRLLADFLPPYPEIPVVVDPVISAKNGVRLLSDKGLRGLIKSVFPKATVVTPNLDEASQIVGKKVETPEDMEACARAIVSAGPRAVVIKGGHLKGDPIDLLFDGSEYTLWKRKRIDRTVHGTGCTFSSLLTAFLVHGYTIKEAFLAAESLMDDLMKASYRINKDGYFFTSSGILNSVLAARWKVLQALNDAKIRLSRINPVEYIPESQLNVGYAVEGAKGSEDVAAFPGRIGHSKGRILFKGEPQFGVSSRLAGQIISFMEYFPEVRSCANIRYDKVTIRKASQKGLSLVRLDRRQARRKGRDGEGGNLDLLLGKILEQIDAPPDIVYDDGDVGREPTIRLFARNPHELLNKMEMIAR
jgi:hydroxymethylpyrimidine kinase / phosphomethylpyrimidine kinase / thiamine-phosphate diphosphorylase